MLALALLLQAVTPPLAPLMNEAREISMARSAAPAELSAQADVYVLRRGGFVKVFSGNNGAACMVSRDHPESLYPICFDPEAAGSILPIELEQQRLREKGMVEDSVDLHIERALARGELKPPTRSGIAYMMSQHQIIYDGAKGRRVGTWFPHIMFYMPYATRAQLAMPGLPNGDLMLASEGKPTAHYVVMAREWSAAPPLPAERPLRGAQPGWICPGDRYVIRDGVAGNDTPDLHPARMEHEFVRPAAACAGRLSVASMAIPPAQASDRIKPTAITNRGSQTVVVTHRGITVRLAPGETSTQFNALPFSGDWAVVVDTGDYNSFCPVPRGTSNPPAPKVDLLIITGC